MAVNTVSQIALENPITAKAYQRARVESGMAPSAFLAAVSRVAGPAPTPVRAARAAREVAAGAALARKWDTEAAAEEWAR